MQYASPPTYILIGAFPPSRALVTIGSHKAVYLRTTHSPLIEFEDTGKRNYEETFRQA